MGGIFDSIRFDSIRFDSIRFDSIRFDSIRFDSIRFDSYSKFQIFESFPAIRLDWIELDSKFENSQLYKRILSFMSSAAKSVPGDL